MIRTRFDLEISINDKVFKLRVSDPTRQQQKKLKKISREKQKQYEKSELLKLKLEKCERDFKIKETLAEQGKCDEAFLLEFSDLNDEIFKLKTQLNSIRDNEVSLEDNIDDYFGEVLRQIISGEQKEAFLAELSELGVSNIVAHDEITKQVQKAKEKKSKTS